MVQPARSARMIPRRVLTACGLNSGRRPKLRHTAPVATFIEVFSCHAVRSASLKTDRAAGAPPWKASLLNLLSRMLRRLCKIEH
jgi:hypothetical protein